MEEYTAITEELYQKFSDCSTLAQEYQFLTESKALTVPYADENPRSKIIAEYFYKVLK